LLFRFLPPAMTQNNNLVLSHPAFQDDDAMPSRKPESCAHRAKLGVNITALRGRRKLTQEQLAEKTGVSARYIQSLEAGEYFPSLPKLVKWCQAFNPHFQFGTAMERPGFRLLFPDKILKLLRF
jgi:DNA-binding XRE family transcriptional regulator